MLAGVWKFTEIILRTSLHTINRKFNKTTFVSKTRRSVWIPGRFCTFIYFCFIVQYSYFTSFQVPYLPRCSGGLRGFWKKQIEQQCHFNSSDWVIAILQCGPVSPFCRSVRGRLDSGVSGDVALDPSSTTWICAYGGKLGIRTMQVTRSPRYRLIWANQPTLTRCSNIKQWWTNLGLSNEYPMIFLTGEVTFPLHGAVVLAFRLI